MTEQEKWKAVAENNAAFDGKFFCAVKSTGIYCRPSCKSRRPLEKNVLFFETAEEAERMGFRPCKRCRPDLVRHEPAKELAVRMKAVIDESFREKKRLSEKMRAMGVTQHRMIQIFRDQFRMTPGEYADGLRLAYAKEALSEREGAITDVAYELGFESPSAFYTFFRKHTGLAPGEYRKTAGNPSEAGTPVPDGKPAENRSFFVYDTAIGKITVCCDGNAVVSIHSGEHPPALAEMRRTSLTDRAAGQLEEYFRGVRKIFDLPLRPEGTAFQQRAWEALCRIPYGETRSYRQMAHEIGNPKACRAVGAANAKNPVLIVIPCHRVIGNDGSLTGYGGGLPLKEWLLAHEKRHSGAGQAGEQAAGEK